MKKKMKEKTKTLTPKVLRCTVEEEEAAAVVVVAHHVEPGEVLHLRSLVLLCSAEPHRFSSNKRVSLEVHLLEAHHPM